MVMTIFFSEGSQAKGFEGVQTAKVAEAFFSPVKRHEAGFLECLSLQIPNLFRADAAMPHQRQGIGTFGLHAGESGRCIEQRGQSGAFGQVAGFGADAACDGLKLRPAG